MNHSMMVLKILLPNEVFLSREVRKLNAEAQNGHFCLLPNHVDYVAALVPGLLTYRDEKDEDHFLAVDEGVLVKIGNEVLVSTRSAAASNDLGSLSRIVKDQFLQLDDREKLAKSASARVEASLVRRFMELEKA